MSSFGVIECQSHPLRKTVVVLFNPSLVGIMGFIIMAKGVSPKVNAVARQEIELTKYNVAANHFSNYATETPPLQPRNSFVILKKIKEK